MSIPRNVAILVFDDIEILDFAGPYEVFNVAAETTSPACFDVYNVGLSLRPVVGRAGSPLRPSTPLTVVRRPTSSSFLADTAPGRS
jgi:transcriptional regulator GlxA family with amidase domain